MPTTEAMPSPKARMPQIAVATGNRSPRKLVRVISAPYEAVENAAGPGFWGAVMVSKGGEIVFASLQGLAHGSGLLSQPTIARMVRKTPIGEEKVSSTAVAS